MAPPTPDAVPPVEHAPAAPVIITPPPAKTPPVFAGDGFDGADALGIAPTLRRLAELVTHAGTATPLAVGFLGAPGSGKSFALHRTLATVRALAAAADKAGGSPFLGRVHVQPVDAAALDGDILGGLAAVLHAGLRQPYPDLARDLGDTARDPSVVLRETAEKLDDARRRLDSERRALDDAGSRRARLTETVLFEAAGSQVDAYARANRAGIERRLAGFGIGGEPVRSFKELVQYAAGSGGIAGLALRSLWAFKGQTKLIVLAVLLALAGVGLGWAIDDQDSWLASLRAGPQLGGVANWIADHMGLLASARTAAFALAAVALAANLWRAFSFVGPILKGSRLLGADLDTRRRDLDGLFAHQTKRVDALERDVERLSRAVAEAERRAGGAGARHEPSPFAAAEAAQAQGFFTALTAALASRGEAKADARPQRIVLALDHLDAVAPERARAILDVLHRAAGPGLVCLLAANAQRLDPKRNGTLERWLQVPVRLGGEMDGPAAGALVGRLLGGGTPAAPTDAASDAPRDATTATVDAPVAADEARMLAAVAPLAGGSPRAVKRFVTLYRLARLEGDAPRGALALALAVSHGGTAAEQEAVQAASGASGGALPAGASARLRAAFDAAAALDGRRSEAEVAAAARQAGRFSFAG